MNLLANVPVLCGSLVRLEPLSVSHSGDLAVAAEEDRGAYGFTRVPRVGGGGVPVLLAGPPIRGRTIVASPTAVAQQLAGDAVLITVLADDAAAAQRQAASLGAQFRDDSPDP
ncbi:MAG TPA: hypothetical protein VIJ82_32095 [Streptosporangiaceae bacterium]|jgi:hypothetical protein